MTQKIRVHLINGLTLDCDVPDEIKFGGLCASIRDSGRWMDDNFYIPADKIAMIVRIDPITGVTMGPQIQGTMQ